MMGHWVPATCQVTVLPSPGRQVTDTEMAVAAITLPRSSMSRTQAVKARAPVDGTFFG
jgi:hypothetical protein